MPITTDTVLLLYFRMSEKTPPNSTPDTGLGSITLEDGDDLQKLPLQRLPELIEKLTEALDGDNSSFDMGQGLQSAAKSKYLKQRAQCYFRVSFN